MGSASFMQEAFLGGEISQSAQGRVSHPLYRASLNIARNMIPVETGALQRRPGNLHCGVTKHGNPGRVITFDFQEATPYEMEFTDGFLRFWADGRRVTTNDTQPVTAISTANPAIVTTAAASGWPTGQHVVFANAPPLLQNRVFSITTTGATTFGLFDEMGSGPSIDGVPLGALPAGCTVSRVLEIATGYTGGTWSNLRSVQAETSTVLLNGAQPQILDVSHLPTETSFATFAMAPSDFLDGPYLDAIKGSYITSSDVSGVVTLTLSFQPYDAAIAYDIGAYVTSAGQGYRSLVAANQGNAPAASPTKWLAVNAGDPINGGAGFISADIGRLIRLLSQPALWVAATAYATGALVTYSDQDDVPGYWQATGAVTGTKPGTTTLWAPVSGASVALWTWGRILTISGAGLTVPDTAIGTLTGGGGLVAAFDGAPVKAFASAANHSQTITTYPAWFAYPYPLGYIVQDANGIYQLVANNVNGVPLNYGSPPSANPVYWANIGSTPNIAFGDYVGQHFTSATQIFSATITPPNDIGFTNTPSGPFLINLRAKSTAPASVTDGTLLGSTGPIPNTHTAIQIYSSDQVTAWHYIWIEIVSIFNQPMPDDGSHSFTCKHGIAQVQFFAPNIANGSVITAQIVGPALLYPATACRTWRLGVYGGTNGWPTNGTYIDERLWLAGVVGNRIDSSKTGDKFNFAPTAPSGAVADDNAISAVFGGPDVNDILWMAPEQQGIICGTQGGEWLVFAPGQGSMSPTNVDARRVTKVGCADIEPRRTDHTLVLAQKFQREIMEYFPDVYSGKFTAPSINERSKHLTVSGVQELAYQQELASIVWARIGNGNLVGTTYKRDSLTTSQGPNVAGAHLHALGDSRQIVSISVGGSHSGTLDALYMITRGGDGIHHVEVMTKLLDEGFNLTDVWQLDDAIAPTSFSLAAPTDSAPYGGVTINGLWMHNGKTVQAWLVGLDCGLSTGADGKPAIIDFLVTNGSIFVPFGDGVSAGSGSGLFTQALIQPYVTAGLPLPGCVGFTFTSDAQIVRPALAPESGTHSGPGFGKLRRAQQYAMQLYGAINGSIVVGMEFDPPGAAEPKMLPIDLRQKDAETPYTVLQPFTGVIRGPVEAENNFDNMLAWRITRPVPGWFVAVGEFLHTQDI
jgi:hypothetical protein